MTRNITIDLTPELDAILVEKATGKDTPETLAARIVAEWCQPHAAAKAAAMLELMKPVGAEIAAAANGDPAKIAQALAAGKAAAIATLA